VGAIGVVLAVFGFGLVIGVFVADTGFLVLAIGTLGAKDGVLIVAPILAIFIALVVLLCIFLFRRLADIIATFMGLLLREVLVAAERTAVGAIGVVLAVFGFGLVIGVFVADTGFLVLAIGTLGAKDGVLIVAPILAIFIALVVLLCIFLFRRLTDIITAITWFIDSHEVLLLLELTELIGKVQLGLGHEAADAADDASGSFLSGGRGDGSCHVHGDTGE